MSKKILGVILACAMFATAGCGAKSTGKTESKPADNAAAESTVTTESVKEEAAATESAAPADESGADASKD